MPVARCWECRLPDPYNGQGDGIGSCDCPRCEDCGARPGLCDGDHVEDWPDSDWPSDKEARADYGA